MLELHIKNNLITTKIVDTNTRDATIVLSVSTNLESVLQTLLNSTLAASLHTSRQSLADRIKITSNSEVVISDIPSFRTLEQQFQARINILNEQRKKPKCNRQKIEKASLEVFYQMEALYRQDQTKETHLAHRVADVLFDEKLIDFDTLANLMIIIDQYCN